MRFTKAIVRPPGANFISALTTQQLGAPNYALARAQHAAYADALAACGVTVVQLEADERYPDATFVEDTAIVIKQQAPRQKPARQQGLRPDQPSLNEEQSRALPDGRATAPATGAAMLTRPGAASRTGEVAGVADALAQFFPELDSISAPGTLDGGDVCDAGNHFFIGISERTNPAGAEQLAGWLDQRGYSANLIDIRGMPNLLHLKSGLAHLGDNRLVLIDSLAQREEFAHHELVLVEAGEAYAANCVRVNDRVLIAAGYPSFAERLRALGYQTIALEMSEFAKMDGGLSCLSLRL